MSTVPSIPSNELSDPLVTGNDGHRTPRWSRAQWRVFVVVTNPKHFDKTREQQYKLAKVSRSRFYSILADPEFRQATHGHVLAQLSSAVAKIINAAAESALLPGRDGHHDRRMLLTMAGLYSDKQTIEHGGSVEHRLTIDEALTRAHARRDEIAKQARESEGLVIEGEARTVDVADPDWED